VSEKRLEFSIWTRFEPPISSTCTEEGGASADVEADSCLQPQKLNASKRSDVAMRLRRVEP
jgi:hypothetical protein